MANKSNYSVTTASVVVCFLLVCFACRGQPITSQQESQERSLDVQLRELSTLVSKSSGIEQSFEHHVFEWDGSILIFNSNPQNFVHVFGLTASRAFVFEMRELKGFKFLADYRPSDAPAVRIPNPIKDPSRYALVALIGNAYDRKHIYDLTELVPVAEQPLTHKGFGLRYLVFDRQWQRQKRSSTGAEFRLHADKACLYIVEDSNRAYIHYTEWPSHPIPTCLTQHLTKGVSRQELLSQVYRKPIARHDWTSTYRDRVTGLKRMWGRREYVDLTLHAQSLVFEDGVWKVFDQSFFSSNGTLIGVERIDNKMVITEVT